MTKILIADDDGLVRMGLRVVLDGESDLEVVGEAEDGRQAIEMVDELHPDLVIMDIRMPNLDGLTATRQIAEGGEHAPAVLVLTTFELDEYVYEALRAGAAGFLLKRIPPPTSSRRCGWWHPVTRWCSPPPPGDWWRGLRHRHPPPSRAGRSAC
jgi:DNA-binding NarL/FixJ family response regulator